VHGLPRTYRRLIKVLEALDGTLGDLGLVESRFYPFGDSVSVGAR
jgi:hypothetical protein